MPLSEYEQRVLDELERDLGSDQKLQSAMSKSRGPARRVVIAILGVLVGLGSVITGVTVQMPIIGVLGFTLMIGVVLWSILAPTKRGPKGDKVQRDRARGRRREERKGFMRRLEERHERRREQGDL